MTGASVQTLPTYFAPAERVTPARLRRQEELFADPKLARRLLDASPVQLAVLNSCRQVVFASRSLLELLGVEDPRDLVGRRPGEALQCVNVPEGPGGCGTSEKCSACGAALSILAGLAGKHEQRQCRITRRRDGRVESLDLKVSAAPIEEGGERFTLFTVEDLSHQLRRRALERIFFHDVLNVAGSVRGFAELLSSYDPENRQEIYQLILSAADQTIDEIKAQRTLLAAENRELTPQPRLLQVRTFLEEQVELYRRHQAAEGRELLLDPPPGDLHLESDPVLLGRVLGNMVKNALEAVGKGERVSVSAGEVDGMVELRVHNPGVIPRRTQLQIFQRSFSTKGADRGLGTYSMKLLSEYLRGDVSFSSSEEQGTIFWARYPLRFTP